MEKNQDSISGISRFTYLTHVSILVPLWVCVGICDRYKCLGGLSHPISYFGTGFLIGIWTYSIRRRLTGIGASWLLPLLLLLLLVMLPVFYLLDKRIDIGSSFSLLLCVFVVQLPVMFWRGGWPRSD
jgi:hypothetical protein